MNDQNEEVAPAEVIPSSHDALSPDAHLIPPGALLNGVLDLALADVKRLKQDNAHLRSEVQRQQMTLFTSERLRAEDAGSALKRENELRAEIQRLTEEKALADRRYELTLNNEIRWMQRAEVAEAEVQRLTTIERHDLPTALTRAEDAEAALAQRSWQPIETAPKDGTLVDVWLGDACEEDLEFYCANGTRRSCAWSWQRDRLRPSMDLQMPVVTIRPTHWMPLPLAPEKGSGQE